MPKTGNVLLVSPTEPQPIIDGTGFSYEVSYSDDIPTARHKLIEYLHSLRHVRDNRPQIDAAVLITGELINNATKAKEFFAGRSASALGGIVLSRANLNVGVLDEVKAFERGFLIDGDRSLTVNGLVIAVTDRLPTGLNPEIDLTPLSYLDLMSQSGKGLYEIGSFTHNLACYRQNEGSKVVSTVVPRVPFSPEYY